jgi:hypothetical protein
MKAIVSVPVHTDSLQRLVAHLSSHGGVQDLAEAVSAAIDGWLRDQSGAAASATESLRGYQWKSLFLPEGTVLRSWSYGDAQLARVVGDQIIHAGRSVSPNQFAQAFARTTRNAWSDLSVKRPGDKHFRPASVLRRELVAQSPPAATPRNTTPGIGWTQPERRKLRFRIEDVGYE